MSSSDSDGKSSSRRKSSERSRSRERERRHTDSRDRKIRIKIPDLSGNLYAFKQFSLLQSEKTSPEAIQKGFDKYKKDWEQRQNEQFVNTCKNDAWFNEKYNPELLDISENEKRELCKRNYQEFVSKLTGDCYGAIEFRVSNVNQIGTVYEQEEDEEQNPNFNNFLSNQTIEVVLDNSIDVKKDPFYGFDPDHATLFLKGLGREVSKYDVKAALEKVEGWKTITMSDPLRKVGFSRNCWIEFHSEQPCQKAFAQLAGVQIKGVAVTMTKAYTKLKRVKVLKNYPLSRLDGDIQTMIKIINKLDKQVGLEDNLVLTRKYETLQKQHDTLLLYMRKIHFFDYYTCTQFDNERMLTLKVGSIFLRIEANYEELANTQTVFKKIQENADKKIEEIIEAPCYSNLLKDEMDKFIRDSYQLAKDATKDIWKCQFCDKKFKSCDFLSKHLITKHDEIKLKKMHTVMEQLYKKDPCKIINYYVRDDNNKFRKNFNSGFRREKKRQLYRDFDEPDNETVAKPKATSSKGMINFLDI